MNLTQIALTAARAFNPKLAEQAERELKNYSQDKAGLQKVVTKYGGEAFLNRAVDFVNTAPRVKKMFNQFGIDPNTLKDNVMKELKNNGQAVGDKHKTMNPANSFKDRLDKMR